MQVIVTGACGFIGSHVCQALLARGNTVVGVDNFNDFYDPRLKEDNRALLARNAAFTLERGSILDPAVLDRACAARPDVVVHLAAWAGVRPSIERPALYVRENVDGTVAVIDALRAQPRVDGALPKLVFASSSSVYGANAKVPFEESDPIAQPLSPYAATKRAGELLAYTYHHLFGLDVTCLRFFTVYGPRQRPEMAIHKFARLMLDGAPVPRYGDGSTRRDYTFIADIVQGVLASVDRCAGFHIYNLGNSRTVTLSELIDKLASALGVTPRIATLPEQPGDVPITYADVRRAEGDLDYHPDYPLERGLAEFAAWIKARA
ncbi:MAG: NAD-dependent epimerase/dehydratase family protein [Deltaproteobacteria bacterium]|nr:NAD-dependent epimerase/dehydratase family protein [Deltaproteobacteria bacterium]